LYVFVVFLLFFLLIRTKGQVSYLVPFFPSPYTSVFALFCRCWELKVVVGLL
jgi:hypothetical protein